jgi:uroporphyrinogen decarboxylase
VIFQNDYRHMLAVLQNKRPARLPIYEHIISIEMMESILNVEFKDLIGGGESDILQYYRHYCRFFKEMTYDTVSFEICITDALPDNGAIFGGRPGPIQNRADFNAYPWDDLPNIYWDIADKHFQAMLAAMPEGMKALGGVGNGVFEISEDLVGFEYLAYLSIDDPVLYADLYRKIGDLMVDIWRVFIERYGEHFAICRFGDDLGFRSNTLVSHKAIRQHIIPQYRRVIDLIRKAGKPFLWHSCGNIFAIMDDVIALGINAKHSNEDAIAPFDRWIDLYGDRIGLVGGIDVDTLCIKKPDEIVDEVVEKGRRFRDTANGYALGSGNSIPHYVPVEGYLAMIEAAKRIRQLERS